MSSFISELRRRNVFNVAAGYAVGAWLLMQLAVVLESSLHLPKWFDTATTVIVMLGFPIAVLLAWIFQFTPSGLVRTIRNPELDSRTHSRNTITIYSLTAVITLSMTLIMWNHLSNTALLAGHSDDKVDLPEQVNDALLEEPERAVDELEQSIAVLPFADYSANEDQSYFGRGISEELLNVLSSTKGLRVVSRTSSFAFSDSDAMITEIAKTLGVKHILEGSVRKSGDTIRITAQLIDAASDVHIWSQTYDRPLSAENLFAVQDEIASEIVSQLKGKLSVAPIASYNKTVSLQAYEYYLQAREQQKLRTAESLRAAQEGFTQVLNIDPNFAPALSGLSETYLLMRSYTSLDQSLSFEQASPLIARALELAPESAEVLTSAAYFESEKQTPVAMQQAREYVNKAISINENYSDAYFLLASIDGEQGRLADAVSNYKKARSLDPLSAVTLANLARGHMFLNDFKNATQVAQELVRLHPDLPAGYSVLADLSMREGAYAQAHIYLQDALSLNPQSLVTKINLRRIYNKVGLHDRVLLYLTDPSTQVWYAIYTQQLRLAQQELPNVENMIDVAWFLYYLRQYDKTKQLIDGYIQAYALLSKPIADSGIADIVLALAHTQEALKTDNTESLAMLERYFNSLDQEQEQTSKALTQRLRLAVLRNDYLLAYSLLDEIINKRYLIDFIDPIFDVIKTQQPFSQRQEKIQALRLNTQEAIKAQIAKPKPTWITP